MGPAPPPGLSQEGAALGARAWRSHGVGSIAFHTDAHVNAKSSSISLGAWSFFFFFFPGGFSEVQTRALPGLGFGAVLGVGNIPFSDRCAYECREFFHVQSSVFQLVGSFLVPAISPWTVSY